MQNKTFSLNEFINKKNCIFEIHQYSPNIYILNKTTKILAFLELTFNVYTSKTVIINFLLKVLADFNLKIVVNSFTSKSKVFFNCGLIQRNSISNFEFISNIQNSNQNLFFNLKNISKSNSELNFKGLGIISKKATKSVFDLKHQALILDSKSKVFSQPELEIFNNKVSAKHSFNSYFMDKKHVFYLNSRGLLNKQINSFLEKSFFKNLYINNPV